MTDLLIELCLKCLDLLKKTNELLLLSVILTCLFFFVRIEGPLEQVWKALAVITGVLLVLILLKKAFSAEKLSFWLKKRRLMKELRGIEKESLEQLIIGIASVKDLPESRRTADGRFKISGKHLTLFTTTAMERLQIGRNFGNGTLYLTPAEIRLLCESFSLKVR